MKNGIVIPEANLRNIEVFDDEPGDEIVAEIKRYAAAKGRVYDWWGNSHTAPPENAHVEYIDEIRLAAPDGVNGVAPCPCCRPFSGKFNTGLVAWFPDERVIRVIGSTCFRNIDDAVEKKKRADLRRRQAERKDRQAIRLHAIGLGALISTVEACLSIFEDLDRLLSDIRSDLEALRVPLSHHAKAGEIWVADLESGTGPDGKANMRRFATIRGVEMISGSQPVVDDLRKLLSGLRWMQHTIDMIGLYDLDDRTRGHLASQLPQARLEIGRIFASYRGRQEFVSGHTLSRLEEWSRHPGAPLNFSISRERRWLNLAVPERGDRRGMRRTVTIMKRAEEEIPELPAIDAQTEDRASA